MHELDTLFQEAQAIEADLSVGSAATSDACALRNLLIAKLREQFPLLFQATAVEKHPPEKAGRLLYSPIQGL